MGAVPRRLSEGREGHPGYMDCLARFQVSEPQSKDTEAEPVLSPGGWHLSRVSPARHLTGNLCGFESKEAAGVCEFWLQRAWRLLSTLGTSRTRTLCEQG